MVSIIKNQLLKHLSRFTKNLSADKINLSTFKGEGELTNLELDEEVLTGLLELPAWVRLTSAWCNKVNFRIQWTKLKSVPIFLSLDEVQITVETCETGRSGSVPSGLARMAAPPGKYSFIHKVIDGMTVTVNTVSVTFKSPAFIASVQMSRIRVESKSPQWERSDLRMTRLKHPEKGTLLTFKELEWQTVRIEAKSTIDDSLTPLRLLTNQAHCRITIKKRVSDCMVLGSRLVLILDELLWVLTDCQLKAALHFLDSLTGLVQATTNVTQRTKAARKLELLPEYQAQLDQSSRYRNAQPTAMEKIFTKYDVIETSYHFLSQGIDLHLCDDPGDGRSCHPHLKEGAALQISLSKFQIDYYPYHLAMADRRHWAKYREASTPPALWLQQALSAFRSSLIDLVDPSRIQHNPLVRANNQPNSPNPSKPGELNLGNYSQTQSQTNQPDSSSTGTGSATAAPQTNSVSNHSSGQNPVKNYVLAELAKLMTTCVILRIEDFTLYRVTTSGKKQVHKEFITGDRDRYSLPEDLPTLHAEFTYFYYPGDNPFPLPPPKFYLHLNPIQVKFDVDSCLWLNSFALNLHQSLMNSSQADNPNNIFYVDLKLESIMSRIIFESTVEHANQRDRPASLHIQVSRASISNVRDKEGSSRADLARCIEKLQTGGLVFGSDFPSNHHDYNVVTDKFLQHVSAMDSVRPQPPKLSNISLTEATNKLYRELMWVDSRDVWCIRLEPIWADFFGARAVGSLRPVPLLDAVPITLWIHLSPKSNNTNRELERIDNRNKRINPFGDSRQNSLASQNYYDERGGYLNLDTSAMETKNADIHVLAYISNLVSLQINHYQFLFLLRLMEEVTELTTFLAVDSNRILQQESSGSMVVAAVVPQVEVTFVMPSQTPGKESSGGDVESVIPDSASLAEDLHLAGNCPIWSQHNSSDSTLKKSANGGPSPLSSPVIQEDVNISIRSINETDLATGTYTAYAANMSSQSILTGKATQANGPTKNVADLAFPSIHKEVNAGLSSMKKGFNSLMNYMDSSKPDDASDTVSIRSDASSDSENYVMVTLQQQEAKTTECMDAMFSLNPFSGGASPGADLKASPVEVASEVIPEDLPTNLSTPSEQSQDSCKRKDLVSMSTFKLSKVEFVQQSSGFKSSIKLQLSGITNEECGCIPWDEFQSKFSSRSRAWFDTADTSVVPCVSLRMEHGPKGVITTQQMAEVKDQKSVLGWFEDNIEVRVKDLPLILTMSTVTGLADLIEDEVIPVPIPMQISLENVSLHLMEDRPPANITSPGPVPIDLHIGLMRIARDLQGVFQIQPVNVESKETAVTPASTPTDRHREKELMSLQITTRQLRSDNEELKRRLGHMDRLSEENRSLRKVKEEMDMLKAYLAAAQDDVTSLLDEKKTLLDTVRVLQEQISSSEHENQNWSSKR